MEQIRYGRKRSGITKELYEKVIDWIESIDDERVKKLVSRNTIVCGGAIASMLLGEQVNDFDLYFRDIETTLAVANYYVNKFKSTEGNQHIATTVVCEGDRVIIYTPSAGAAVSADAPPQFDQIESGVLDDANFTPEDTGTKYRPLFLSENAISLSHKVQLITRFYGEPDEIFDNYDFIHAYNFFDYGSRKLELKPEALEAILSRTLIYKGSLYPVASLFRMKKFMNRGWRISAGQILKIAFQISELDLHDPKVLREQLTGVDVFFMNALIVALESVDPQVIDASYVAKLIDKIFKE